MKFLIFVLALSGSNAEEQLPTRALRTCKRVRRLPAIVPAFLFPAFRHIGTPLMTYRQAINFLPAYYFLILPLERSTWNIKTHTIMKSFKTVTLEKIAKHTQFYTHPDNPSVFSAIYVHPATGIRITKLSTSKWARDHWGERIQGFSEIKSRKDFLECAEHGINLILNNYDQRNEAFTL